MATEKLFDLQPITAGDLIGVRYPRSEELWGPVIQKKNLVLLYAQRGIGKTLAGLKLAHSIASGNEFLKFKPERPERVIYFDGEMGKQTLQTRLLDIENDAPISVHADAMAFITFQECGGVMWNLSDRKFQKFYDKASENYPVIVIDNLFTCSFPIDARDDDVQQWRRVQEWAISKREQGKTVIFIHHSAKNGEQWGTVMKEATMDTLINLKPGRYLEADNEISTAFELHFEKSRHFGGKDKESLFVTYKRDSDGISRWHWTTHVQHQADMVLKLVGRNFKKREIGLILGLSNGFVEQVLREHENKAMNRIYAKAEKKNSKPRVERDQDELF